MSQSTAIQNIIQTRKNFQALIAGLDGDQLNQVPDGFSNNIIWNYGHAICTMLLLTYGRIGQQIPVSTVWLDEFRKGSKPQKEWDDFEIQDLIEFDAKSLEQFQEDLELGRFENFELYETSYGIQLKNIQEALAFDNIHEGLHLGVAMSLRHLV